MIPIIILAIENDDDREFMTALYMQYHSLMYKLIFDIVKSPWDIRMALVRAKRKARKAMADMAPA